MPNIQIAPPGQCEHCDERRKSIRPAQRRWDANAQLRTSPEAFRKGQPWTGPDLETALARTQSGTYLRTASDVAAMLGRTYAGVKRAREAHAREIKLQLLAGMPNE